MGISCFFIGHREFALFCWVFVSISCFLMVLSLLFFVCMVLGWFCWVCWVFRGFSWDFVVLVDFRVFSCWWFSVATAAAAATVLLLLLLRRYCCTPSFAESSPPFAACDLPR